ncbi:GNAT family N-acetyltransferase [Vibrio gallaecicus]|uniref:GNAT family N-acetyltransferase n=1 Tax=Vibrio gallaecicus TaxID=552386 RepID=A0ABV4NGM8_9VIBR
MIRPSIETDIRTILDIWFNASIKAHDFVAADFWQSQVDNMRDIYLPASQNFVFELDSDVVGFYSLYENTLAAIFVSPEIQRKGIGKQLIAHAKAQVENGKTDEKEEQKLILNVYAENEASFNFYLSQGFEVESQHKCEHTGCLEYMMKLKN